MEATTDAWLAQWRRRARRPRPRGDYRPRLTFYTGHYVPDQGGSVFRFEESPGTRPQFPTPNPWPQPLNFEHMRLLLPQFNDPKFPPPAPFEPYAPEPEAPAPARGFWVDSTLGWLLGIVLLGLFVLLVRTTEKCLDRRLFHNRRQAAIEAALGDASANGRHNAAPGRLLPQQVSDPPPAYSECLAKPQREESPPPYSDCYVTFSNPKDGIPSAHIMSRDNRADVGETSDGTNEANKPEDNVTCANVGANPNVANKASQSDGPTVGNGLGANGQDVEANAGVETVGVHVGSNARNANNCVIVNENPSV